MRNQQGYIALISVIAICLILVGLTFLMNVGGFSSRFSVLGSEYKRVSLGLSESCVNAALLKVAKDYSYQIVSDPAYVSGQGVEVQVGTDQCYIKDITSPDANHKRMIKTQAHYQDAFSNMEISVDRKSVV